MATDRALFEYTTWKDMRARFVMWVARMAGVPVDVHQRYFR